MKLFPVICLSFFCLLASIANAQSTVITNISKPIVLTRKNSIFTIQLVANPSTGYQWFLSHYNSELIQPLRYRYKPAKSNKIGAPGHALWTFRLSHLARKVPTLVQFTLTYARGWEIQAGQAHIVKVVTVS